MYMGVTALNGGPLPMSNGITRLQTRFLGTPRWWTTCWPTRTEHFDAETADGWAWRPTRRTDRLGGRSALGPRGTRSELLPDALTGMEANLRFAARKPWSQRSSGV
ncbi:MAG: hypothetical protein R3E96_10645 [Planctomycetota bacterium]